MKKLTATWDMKLQKKDKRCKELRERARSEKGRKEGVFYVDENDILWIQFPGKKKRRPCVVVPQALKAFILRRHHGLPFSGHPGRNKTYANLRERYWWQEMSMDDGLRLEYMLNAFCTHTEDFDEGPSAFIAKRKAEFKGR